jgi:hypothetical protein
MEAQAIHTDILVHFLMDIQACIQEVVVFRADTQGDFRVDILAHFRADMDIWEEDILWAIQDMEPPQEGISEDILVDIPEVFPARAMAVLWEAYQVSGSQEEGISADILDMPEAFPAQPMAVLWEDYQVSGPHIWEAVSDLHIPA